MECNKNILKAEVIFFIILQRNQRIDASHTDCHKQIFHMYLLYQQFHRYQRYPSTWSHVNETQGCCLSAHQQQTPICIKSISMI
jgi:hypothetical protein